MVDYCPRNLVQMSELLEEEGSGGSSGNPLPRLPYGMSHAKNLDLKQVVLFTLLQNHEHKTIEWLLTFPTEAEKSQWIQLVTPDTKTENPGEKIYQDWDCPLVEAVASIQPEASNEIPLQKGEKANVLRKLSDSGMNFFPNFSKFDLALETTKIFSLRKNIIVVSICHNYIDYNDVILIF